MFLSCLEKTLVLFFMPTKTDEELTVNFGDEWSRSLVDSSKSTAEVVHRKDFFPNLIWTRNTGSFIPVTCQKKSLETHCE